MKARSRRYSRKGRGNNAAMLARRQLGVQNRAVDYTLSSVLKFIRGGKKSFMELARQAPNIDPSLASVIEEWDRLTPTAQRGVNLNQLCEIKGIDPFHFLGVVAEAGLKFSNNASVLIAALSLPKIVQCSIKRALTPEGVEDCKMLFQHAGFIPSPKGTEVRVLNQIRVSANVNQAADIDLPSFEETIGAID
jgi:hypothetical protein